MAEADELMEDLEDEHFEMEPDRSDNDEDENQHNPTEGVESEMDDEEIQHYISQYDSKMLELQNPENIRPWMERLNICSEMVIYSFKKQNIVVLQNILKSSSLILAGNC